MAKGKDDGVPIIGDGKLNGGKVKTTKDVLIEETKERPNWHWDKHEIESPTSAPLLDPMAGREVLMRRFLITIPKEFEKSEGILGARKKVKPPPSGEKLTEIVEHHKRAMLENLRHDGWEPFADPQISLVRPHTLSLEDRATLPKVVMHNWLFAVIWRCYAEYGMIREATHQNPHSVTALMNEAAKRQSPPRQ